jgi:hypothetical protein
VAVQAITADDGRKGQVAGRDMWRGAALVSVEAALALVEPSGPARGGVFAPAEALRAGALLARLEKRGAFTASPGLLPPADDEPLLRIA